MKKLITLTLLLAVMVTLAAHANDMQHAIDGGKDMILDVVRQVLKVVVEFIGDVLDEFVRAIRDLMHGTSTKN
ncbi:MAG: hypothetical protein WAX89_00960 [Alphaproteobacteria bacterium]